MIADFLTGFVGGALSVLLAAFLGRFLAARLIPLENARLVGFCLAAGLVLGRGTVVSGSPTPEEVELAGRALASLLVLVAIWFAWFRRRPSEGSGQGRG